MTSISSNEDLKEQSAAAKKGKKTLKNKGKGKMELPWSGETEPSTFDRKVTRSSSSRIFSKADQINTANQEQMQHLRETPTFNKSMNWNEQRPFQRMATLTPVSANARMQQSTAQEVEPTSPQEQSSLKQKRSKKKLQPAQSFQQQLKK